jgi:hypothetical protein
LTARRPQRYKLRRQTPGANSSNAAHQNAPQRSIVRRPKWANREDGVDFVRCRICGARRRVVSGWYLSKHDIDREAYIHEYGLRPDELIGKDFRRIQSSRPGFYPHGKREWITAIKKVYQREGEIFVGRLHHRHRHLYE